MNYPNNHNKDWTKDETDYIKESAKNGMSTKDIAKKLERTEDSIRNKASEEKISLKPKDI